MRKSRVTILAFDPGGSTGWAAFRAVKVWPDKGSIPDYLLTEYECGWFGPNKHHKTLYDFMVRESLVCEQLHIVTESFEYRNESRAGLVLMSRDYIGVIELYAQQHPTECRLVMQSPAQAKGFTSNANLKKLGLYVPGDEMKHSMDAYRHLFWYLIHNVKIMPEKFLQIGWTV